MDHIKALAIKFVAVAVVLYSILGIFYTATLGEIFMISLLVTGVAYVVGDLFILPRFGNLTATIADFGLSFVAVWFLSAMLIEGDFAFLSAALFSALFITAIESLFHMYMQRHVLDEQQDNKEEKNRMTTQQLQTEFAEEDEEQGIIKLSDEVRKNEESDKAGE
ncbi:YndM family protein [Sediminibacillus massiliensis]|uniref:YndM family protein n=1 Tax=Sediminibacillus massiliensis TaxID=1926277 RepID=UPI0015C3B520|nr:YndM family protein [Sediminibacillus massiliensis]